MYCSKCGHLVAANAQFCPECGEKLNPEVYQNKPEPQMPPHIYVYPIPYPDRTNAQPSAQISALKLAIGACLILGTVFYALYYFIETVPGLFRAMKQMPFFALCGLLSDLGFLGAMGLTLAHLFIRDPRHTVLKAATGILIGAGAVQALSYVYLAAEGYQLKTPGMLILLQVGVLACGILMLMNLLGALQTNLITVPVAALVSLLMLIGMLITKGNTALSIMGALGYVLYFAALAMLFMNVEEPSLIPGRRADGLR